MNYKLKPFIPPKNTLGNYRAALAHKTMSWPAEWTAPRISSTNNKYWTISPIKLLNLSSLFWLMSQRLKMQIFSLFWTLKTWLSSHSSYRHRYLYKIKMAITRPVKNMHSVSFDSLWHLGITTGINTILPFHCKFILGQCNLGWRNQPQLQQIPESTKPKAA